MVEGAGNIQSRMAAWLTRCGVNGEKAKRLAADGKLDSKDLAELNSDSAFISPEFRALVDGGMDAAAKGNSEINEDEFVKMEKAIAMYSKVFGVTPEKAEELYRTAKTFQNADLEAMDSSKTDIAEQTGLKSTMTLDQALAQLKIKGVPANIIASLKAYATVAKPAGLEIKGTEVLGGNCDKLLARLAAMPGISTMGEAQQKAYFNIDTSANKLTPFTGTYTKDEILQYLGLKKAASTAPAKKAKATVAALTVPEAKVLFAKFKAIPAGTPLTTNKTEVAELKRLKEWAAKEGKVKVDEACGVAGAFEAIAAFALPKGTAAAPAAGATTGPLDDPGAVAAWKTLRGNFMSGNYSKGYDISLGDKLVAWAKLKGEAYVNSTLEDGAFKKLTS